MIVNNEDRKHWRYLLFYGRGGGQKQKTAFQAPSTVPYISFHSHL